MNPQAETIVRGARIDPEERNKNAVLAVDARRRVITSSEETNARDQSFQIETGNQSHGFYTRGDGTTVAFHATSGYEAYRGLGWHGVIVRRPS